MRSRCPLPPTTIKLNIERNISTIPRGCMGKDEDLVKDLPQDVQRIFTPPTIMSRRLHVIICSDIAKYQKRVPTFSPSKTGTLNFVRHESVGYPPDTLETKLSTGLIIL